jgi:hypothetical protein
MTKPREQRDQNVVTPFWKTLGAQLKAKTKQMVQQSCMKAIKIKGRFRLSQREAKRNQSRHGQEYDWIRTSAPL